MRLPEKMKAATSWFMRRLLWALMIFAIAGSVYLIWGWHVSPTFGLPQIEFDAVIGLAAGAASFFIVSRMLLAFDRDDFGSNIDDLFEVGMVAAFLLAMAWVFS